ncbi:MAG: response regulator transcription factor [Bacteroidota bacterium]|nr:response regulator transcription factor [Bacteroidota bacterium]MDP4192194.1 response regulator transcription factor [Bacteroidota bacterium]MDP4196509.1 response regulator transcription factor [Bacteroidota bacterium]
MKNNNTIKIVLADDHALVRTAFRNLVNEFPQMNVVAEASDGNELLNIYNEYDPDVIISDIAMRNLTGLEAVRRIKEKDKNVKALFLSLYADINSMCEALFCGGLGLISKSISLDKFISAIEAVYRGEYFFFCNNEIVNIDELLKRYEAFYSDKDPSEILKSSKEYEVLSYVIRGYQSKEIADIMFLSRKSVDSYRSSLLKKFNVSSTVELLREAYLRNLI